jgi:hypothetical protein
LFSLPTESGLFRCISLKSSLLLGAHDFSCLLSCFFLNANACLSRLAPFACKQDVDKISASGTLKLEISLLEEPPKGATAAVAAASKEQRRAKHGLGVRAVPGAAGHQAPLEPLREPLTQCRMPALLGVDSPWEVGPAMTLVSIGCGAKVQRAQFFDRKVRVCARTAKEKKMKERKKERIERERERERVSEVR